MRYLVCVAFLFSLIPVWTVAAQEPAEEGATNIFLHLQIELLDLEKLGEEVLDRLVGETLRLTLDESVLLALDGNQDILISGYEPLMSQGDLQGSRGEFDPTLTGRFSLRDASTPPSPTQFLFTPPGFLVPDENIEQRDTLYDLTLGGKLLWGTQYELAIVGDRSTGTFSLGNAVYGGDVTLTLTQPILRGFGADSNRVRIRTARNSVDISATQLETTVLTSIGDVIMAYWDLVGTIEQLKVREESFANAMRLVDINQQRFEIGTAAAIEVLQAKAGAASRQSDLITARTNILDSEDVLKDLMGLYDGDLLSFKSIEPTERPNPVKVDADFTTSINIALENRPEVRGAILQVENSRLELASARDGLLPQVDLTGSYGINDRTLDFDRTVRGVVDSNGDAWSIGIIGSIPIGNRAARGEHKRAKFFVRQQEQRLKQTQQMVMLSVRMAVRSIYSSYTLIESNKITRTLQEANVAAEEKRLQLGVTTSQDVLDIQEDLTEAQTQEIQSMVNYEKALIELQVSEGVLLRNRGIIYEPHDDDDPLGFFRSIGPIRSTP